ncbi:MAG: hypothetical protein LBT12_02380 [Oscillospiraceae bacterium]|jgi:hypothetical protein|nr:hypothetical protein [Oscillospiraceae bacterium]
MKKSTKVLISVAVVLVLAVTVYSVTMLAANSGTQTDPLVTLSYLTDKFKPQLIAEIKEEIAKAGEDVSKKLDEKLANLPASTPTPPVSAPSDGADAFSVITLSNNQTVKCAVGTELLLRVGTATAAGASPGLVDSTTGGTLAAGGALETNHMYLVTIENNGFTAAAATVKVLIRGVYAVG